MARTKRQYSMLVNLDRCVGCYACQVTCKSEYNLPLKVFRCRVDTFVSGEYPELRKIFLPRFCNHCESPPCISACDENALYKNNDGLTMFNRDNCKSCQQCYDTCPYNAITINPQTGLPEKCDFCYERRLLNGRLPVCVESCMGKAITFGHPGEIQNVVSSLPNKNNIKIIESAVTTHPSVFYILRNNLSGSPLVDYKLPDDYPTVKPRPLKKLSADINLVYSSDAMCPSECGIAVEVKDGIARHIYGNPHSLISNGTFCAKGASGLALTYSPLRIKSPLRRKGDRGDDKWEEISWEEAANHIAKSLIKLKKIHGPECVFLDCGDVTDREAYYRLFHAFGTPNTFNHGSICDPNRRWGQGIMTGDERPLPDLQRPFLTRDDDGELYLRKEHDIKLLINIGVNPFVATRFNYMSSGIPAAREENNCFYIVIDPSYTNSASHADMWLPIIPGSDAALLASILLYIIKSDSPGDKDRSYIDHEFIKNYTTGWDEFRDTFLSWTKKRDKSNDLYFFSIQWASEKTGISEDNLKKISHLFGITKPSAIEIGMHGVSHHYNGDISSILMTALCLITGNVDRPGGLVFTDSQKVKKGSKTVGHHLLTRYVNRKINGKNFKGRLSELHKDLYGDYPAAWKGVLSDIPEKIRTGIRLKHGPFKGLHYPLKAFISRAGNPFITAGNTKDWIEAFTLKDSNDDYMLKLFVFIDTHITETGKYADIVLPEAGFLERMGTSDVYTMSPEIAIRDRVIKPLHKSKSPYEIMMCLSEALWTNGDPDIRKQDFQYDCEESFINEILSEAPGFFNVGNPLPYPDLPEGCRILGTPDNPSAIWGKTVIKEGEPLTVDWLRKNNGVAVWPAGYYRYKKIDGSPSGVYPKTSSGKFEFRFSYLEKINQKFGTDFPHTFYWAESRWNPRNESFKKFQKEYPFQLTSGRSHYSMTMTGICAYLAETETECLKPFNDTFRHHCPGANILINEFGKHAEENIHFESKSISIPVLAINTKDGKHIGLKSGDTIMLENPYKATLRGKVYLTDEIRPGTIKMIFGPGGQKASGTGLLRHVAEYTQNINRLYDSNNLTPLTGMPGFGDIMVRIIKQQ